MTELPVQELKLTLKWTSDTRPFHYYTRTSDKKPTITMPTREGHQSPPPEESSDKQVNKPASGTGTDDSSNKEQTNQAALDNLSSNPKGPLDDAVTDKFSKNKPATRAEE
ncbi:hypothetical protein DL546_009283 [Coniochaeta pulveracea]|uniref:Uncharacterized protein n=1 Tax=Coniochaeta pulveracea TaxID=177199 RepID=A0A420YMW9_9PEZI|nr:hypothetical protein DL546_009283 [Coniochaeta pulveracea]